MKSNLREAAEGMGIHFLIGLAFIGAVMFSAAAAYTVLSAVTAQ